MRRRHERPLYAAMSRPVRDPWRTLLASWRYAPLMREVPSVLATTFEELRRKAIRIDLARTRIHPGCARRPFVPVPELPWEETCHQSGNVQELRILRVLSTEIREDCAPDMRRIRIIFHSSNEGRLCPMHPG